MFDTLDERIKQDENEPAKQKFAKWAAYLVIAVVLFGGLYFMVKLSE